VTPIRLNELDQHKHSEVKPILFTYISAGRSSRLIHCSPVSTMSKPAQQAPLFKNEALHLAFCVVGVVGSLLLYGVLQVWHPGWWLHLQTYIRDGVW